MRTTIIEKINLVAGHGTVLIRYIQEKVVASPVTQMVEKKEDKFTHVR